MIRRYVQRITRCLLMLVCRCGGSSSTNSGLDFTTTDTVLYWSTLHVSGYLHRHCVLLPSMNLSLVSSLIHFTCWLMSKGISHNLCQFCDSITLGTFVAFHVLNQSVNQHEFVWLAPYVTEEWIKGANGWLLVSWCVSGIEEMYFRSNLEGSQGASITDRSRYIVPGSRCRDCKWVFVEVRRDMRCVISQWKILRH